MRGVLLFDLIFGINFESILFVLPLYFINAFLLIQAVFVKKFTGKENIFFDKPISKKIFGENKTWLGLFFSVTLCTLFYFFLGRPVFAGLLIGLFMFFGILASSFLKRRLGKACGEKCFLDTIDFLIGGSVGYFIFFGELVQGFVLLIPITFVLHRFANIIAFKLKLKKVPW